MRSGAQLDRPADPPRSYRPAISARRDSLLERYAIRDMMPAARIVLKETAFAIVESRLIVCRIFVLRVLGSVRSVGDWNCISHGILSLWYGTLCNVIYIIIVLYM